MIWSRISLPRSRWLPSHDPRSESTPLRLGIVSDIHEAVELLERALGLLAREEVDRLVFLGDVFETGARIDAAVRILGDSGAVGVYGNHDYGLSTEPTDYIRRRYSSQVLAYMGSLLPRMEIDGAFFAHREPCLDCSEVMDIWHVDDEELPEEAIARSFAAIPHRSIFIGHFHRWAAFTKDGPLDWRGESQLVLPEGPTMVVIGAVVDGHAATFDTTSRVLTPIDLLTGVPRSASE